MEDKDTGEYKLVSQCDMKELDAMGYVKADATWIIYSWCN